MSLYGEWKDCAFDISDSTTISDACDLGNNYEYIQVIYPAMTACTMSVYVCSSLGGTYVPLGNSASATVGASASADTYAIGGYQFIKLISSTAQLADRAVIVRGLRA